ncbi:starch synthase [Rhizoctonia solani]|uniref:Starch synthase n=1 Tax=Rhizoctonia solani TaxID=456999 RepID=A0A0K6G066_9AGAM|nr:starch synthase [Rhizoctonia solani]
MHTRSTGGCTTCRRKKKKCDETKPECLRCQRSGNKCEGYAGFENPDGKGIMRRARPGPAKITDRPATSTSARSSQKTTAAVSPDASRPSKNAPKRPVVPSQVPTTRDQPNDNNTDQDTQNTYTEDPKGPESSSPDDAYVSPESRVSDHLPTQTIVVIGYPNDAQAADPLVTIPHATIEQIDESPYDARSSNVTSSSYPSSSPSHDLARRSSATSMGPSDQSPQGSALLTPGQASLYDALFSLASGPRSTFEEIASQRATTLPPAVLKGPAWPSPNSTGDNEEDEEDEGSEKSEDDDPEGVKHAMCTTVTPDANVETNALPFVLQSYAQWVNFMVFDPKNVVHVIREGVIAQFSSSQDIRTRVILLSNVFGALGKSPVLNSKVRSVVTYLSAEAHQSIVRFTSTEPAPLREMDMMNALKSIDLMMEVILLRRFGGSISTIVGLMQAASPVFRRACPEPLGQLVNLPNILISPSINLRHYAETDIMTATLLARPMFLRYDILYTPEINEQFTGQQAGLHWLHGIPDQLIILLAWINMLHEDLGTNVDPLLISQIEMEVERVKITPSTSDDPVYTIRRYAVQECWRLVVYMHLYVTLCGAHAEDPRVVKFVKRFMRFLGGIKPARTVDTFLSLPIMFIGTFVSRKQDRDLLFRRLTTMQECTMPGRAGHDCLMVLCDIWKRTEQEQRPARWVDLRISCQTIAGV